MRVIFGSTQVSTATTRVQLSATADQVKKIQFQTRVGNTGRMFVGLVDVALATNSWELEIPVAARPIAHLSLDFGEGSVPLSTFYADATVNNDRIDWVAIVRS